MAAKNILRNFFKHNIWDSVWFSCNQGMKKVSQILFSRLSAYINHLEKVSFLLAFVDGLILFGNIHSFVGQRSVLSDIFF